MPAPAQQKEPLDPVRAQYKEGRELLQKGDLAAAAMALHNALKGFEEQGDLQGVANAAARLGDICAGREEFSLALEHYQHSREICRQLGDPFSLVSLDKKLTTMHRLLGQFEQALVCCSRMLDHYGDTKNPQGMVQVLEMLVDLYQDAGQRDKAVDTLRTIASIHRSFKHERTAQRYEEQAQALEQGQ
ncbi:MAG: hypothetical protein BWK76_23290 [Desulfobulbaceae bacterium A2]|nr:MAG: hypothetical protein BWK76_23290 [Desulfobulbaceae bacterium A2]